MNTIIVFLVSGLWHGADWNFVIWGSLHAICYIVTITFIDKRKYHTFINSNDQDLLFQFFSVLFNFLLVSVLWVFFRVETLQDALMIIQRIFMNYEGGSIQLYDLAHCSPKLLIIFITVLFIVEWYGRYRAHPLHHFERYAGASLRYLCYYLLLASICFFSGGTQSFVYFQF